MNAIDFIKRKIVPLFPYPVINWLKRTAGRQQLRKWEASGKPLPPPHIVKQLAIAEYGSRYHCDTLVETGTFRGDMVQAQKKNFRKVISIELGQELYEKAIQRFSGDANVTILQGDSGKVLGGVVKDLKQPAVFWLDGHYSGGVTAKGSTECPVFEEVDAILGNPQFNHVLLIDDARCFVGEGDYPSVEELTDYIRHKNTRYTVAVKDDIIRYTI